MKALLIVGTRPNYIKCAPIYKAMVSSGQIDPVIVDSGQHYDPNMNDIFFEDLGIRRPHYNLNVGSGSHGVQTGRMLEGLDPILEKENPDVVVVMGDTNTTLAGALAAYKQGYPLAHIEAGMREGIWRPEEINKKMADHCSEFCFCPTPSSVATLQREGISDQCIFHTGDITYDVFMQTKRRLETSTLETICGRFGVEKSGYALMTLHRAETVDHAELLTNIVSTLTTFPFPILFSVHPRTRKRLVEFGLLDSFSLGSSQVKVLDPLGYNDFISLMLHSRLVITDSSGTLKDTFYSERPCVVIDDTSEYAELLEIGMTKLVGRDCSLLKQTALAFWDTPFHSNSKPLGDGRAAERMVEIILNGTLTRKR